jgi:hypothetical protein
LRFFFFLHHEFGDDAFGLALLAAFEFVDGFLQSEQVLLALAGGSLGLTLLGDHCCFIIYLVLQSI